MKINARQLNLYAVTDRSWLKPGETLVSVTEELLKAGVTCVQLREKHMSDEEILKEASLLKDLCDSYQVPLIINDRPDLAKKSGASGVHVGLSDMGIQKARKLLGEDFIIGGSAHNVEEALAAEAAGADYLGCGAVFGSTTKTNVTQLPVETLKAICKAVKIPVVAIGGVNSDNPSAPCRKRNCRSSCRQRTFQTDRQSSCRQTFSDAAKSDIVFKHIQI